MEKRAAKAAGKIVAFALAIACTMAFAGCASAPSESGGSGEASGSANPFPGSADADTVVIDITAEPADLNPLKFSDTMGQTVLAHCMAGLTRLDANDEPVADIAESWDVSEDGTIYTMHLRKDALWSNGDPVTANDFYYSWMSQMAPDSTSMLADLFYENIKGGEAYFNGTGAAEQVGLKVVDDYTLSIEWTTSKPTALSILAQPSFFPVQQKAFERIGADKYGTSVDTMLTNGPYALAEWVHDDHVLLVKDEGYFGADSINIPKVKLTMINDNNTRLNAFMAGEVDMINLYGDQIQQVRSQGPSAVSAYADGGSWYLEFNTTNHYLSNANMRRALTYAVDVQSLLDNVVKDDSVVAGGLVPEGIAGAEGDYAEARGTLLSADPEAAASYLDKALDELGVTIDEVHLSLSAYDSTYSQTQAAYLQQQWKEKLGLDVDLAVTSYKALFESRLNGDFDLCVSAWAPNEDDATSFLKVFSSGNPNNYGGYSNAAYDELLVKADQQQDEGKRQELLIEAEKLIMDDMAVGPLYHTSTTYASSAKLEGATRTPFQLFNVYSGACIVSQS